MTRFLQRQLIQFVSESPEEVVAVAPVRLDLNVELEEDFFLEESLHVTPCRRADLLERLPTVTDDDTLLRVAFHDDERANVYLLRALNELLDNDFRGVGDLFLIVEQDFFPDISVTKKRAGRSVRASFSK